MGLATMTVAPSAAGTDAYILCMGTDPSGNPTVWQMDYTFPSPWFWQIGTVTTGAGYHNYELVQVAGAATANLYVDGSLLTAVNPTGAFGASTYTIGNTAGAYGSPVGVYLAGASLNTIPEPSTLALLTIGLFGLLAYAWRKRR